MTAYAKSHHRSQRSGPLTARRTTLRIGTALAGGLFGLALAQPVLASPVLPTLPTVKSVASGVVGDVTFATNGPATKLSVSVKDSTIIDWSTFSIGGGGTVSYAGCLTSCTVVNRVTGGTASQIDGAIDAVNSTHPINIWLFNTAGIAFSKTGSFSGGSLVLSTLGDNVTDATKLTGTAVDFKTGAGTIALDGAITSSGSVLLVGQSIGLTNTGALLSNISATGPVVMVAGADVSFPAGPGSPLSYLIKGGTPVAVTPVSIAGKVTGSQIMVGAMSPGGGVASLLQVATGGSLTATANGGSVTLSTTNDGTVTGDTTVADGGLITATADRISFNGGAVAASGTGGSVLVYAPSVLDADTMLTGAATFAGTLDGGKTLTVTGNAEFDKAVGGATALAALGVSGTTLIKAAAITTTGAQTYSGAVTLGADTTLAGTVQFAGALDGGKALTVTGDAEFDGAVGGTTKLTSLGVSGTTLIKTAAISTTGAQTYTGAVTLGANTTLTGAVKFAGTLDGGKTLAVTGNAEFDNAVGGTTKLTSLGVSGTTLVKTAAITTTGTQAYTGAVTLGVGTTLTTTNSDVGFGSTVNGTFGLTVAAGTGGIALAGQAGGTAALGTVILTGKAIGLAGVDAGALTITNSGTLTLNGGDYTIGAAPYTFTSAATTNGTLTLGQATTFGGAVTLGSDTTINGANAAFTQTVDGGSALAIGKAATFGGVVGGGTALSSLTVTGASTINGGAITTSGVQDYKGAATLGAATVLKTANSNVTFESTIGSASAPDFTINAGTGTVSLQGQTGTAAAPLGLVKLTGDGVSLAGVASSFLQPVLTNGSVLTLNTGIYVPQGGASYSFGAFGPVIVNGTLTLGQASFFGALTLGSATTLDASANNKGIQITGQVTGGGFDLTIKAGSAPLTLAGVSGTKSLTLGDGSLRLLGGTYDVDGGGAYDFGPVYTDGTLVLGQVTTFGAVQLFNDTVINGANAIFSGTIDGTVSGIYKLSVGKNATFDGAIGGAFALTGLTVTGTSTINAATITTTGNQTYTGAVTLGANTILTSSGNGTVTLGAVTGGANSLKINAGAASGSIVLNGVSGTSALVLTDKTLTLNGGTYDVDGGAAYNFGSGPVLVNGTLTLGQDTTFGPMTLTGAATLDGSAGHAVSLGTVDGSFDLAVKTGASTATLGGAIGATTALTSLSVTGPGTINGGAITTSGNQTYTGAVTLGANTVLTSTGNGTATLGAVTGAGNSLKVDVGTASGAIVLNGVAGTSGLILIDKTLTLNTGTYTPAAGADFTFGDATANGTLILGQSTLFQALKLDSATTLDGSVGNHAITLGSPVNGAQALTVKTGIAAITAEAQIGGNTALGAVTMTGGVIRLAGVDAASLTLNNGSTLRLDTGNYTIGTAPFAVPYAFGVATVDGTLTLGQATTFGALTLAAGTTINSSTAGATNTGAPLTFASIAGAQDLTVNAGASTITINNGVGTSVTPLTSLSLTAGGGITLPGGPVYTTGAQTYAGQLNLTVDTTLDSSAGGGDITLGTTVNAAVAPAMPNFTVNAGTGSILASGAMGSVANPLGAVSLTGRNITLSGLDASAFAYSHSGTLLLTGGDYTIGSGATFDFGDVIATGTLTLGQPTTFGAFGLANDTTIAGADVTFGGAVDGAYSLTVNKNGTFAAAVGGSQPLTKLIMLGNTAINGGKIVTTGTQGYTGAVTLGANTLLDSSAGSGAIVFDQTLDGGFDLVTKAGAGLTVFSSKVGSMAKLASLTITGDAAIDGGGVVTSGLQDYKGLVSLGAATVLDSSTGNGAITFAKMLDGTHDLTVAAGTGLTTFGGTVGSANALTSLTVTGASVINGGSVTTKGLQDYQGAVTIGAATTLDSSAGNGAITFEKTLDGGFDLTATAGTGLTTFTGAVGGTARLASLTVTGTSAINGGSVTTTGLQDYKDAATIGAATTLDSSAGNGTITFEKTLDGGFDLTATAGTGLTTFTGAVGSIAKLASLTVTGTSAINGGSVSTTGLQDYKGAATLGAATLIDSSANNGAITFEKTLDGGFDLTAMAGTGLTTFTGAVGSTAKLASLVVTGASAINGGAVTTTGLQYYKGAATIGAATLLDSSAGNGAITFGNTLDGGFALTTKAGTGLTSFAGNVGQTNPLGALTVSGPALFTAFGVLTSGAQDYQGAVSLATPSILFDSTPGNGAITFEKTVDGLSSLTARAGTGLTTFRGTVGATTELGSVSVTGAAAINGGLVATGNAQQYLGAVTLGAATTLDNSAGAGNIGFGSTLDGGFALTTKTGPGVTIFGGPVGGLNPLASLTVFGLAQVSTGTITTAGAQDFKGAVTLFAPTVTFDSSAGNGAITFEQTLDGGSAVTMNTGSGTTTFGGAVGGITLLTSLAVNGAAAINGGAVTTAGGQSYQGAVTLGMATTLDTSAFGGALQFAKTLDGGFDLAAKVGAGQATFGGAVGGLAKLASLSVTGASAINGGAVTTTNAQDYQGAVTLGAATTLDSTAGNGAISFAATLDGGFALTATAGTGLTTFTGAVGSAAKLASLTVSGASAINGGSVTTTGAQDYKGAATIGAATTFDSSAGNGAISFEKTLDGAFALTATAGTGQTTFGGAVGGTAKLASLTVTGTSAINGGSVTTTGAQDYQGAATIGAATTLDSSAGNGAITFGKTLDGGFDLTANAGTGLTSFGGAVGGTARLASLTVAGASAINGGSVTTTGLQDYKGAVALNAATMLDSSAGNGAISFEKTLDGGFALGIRTGTGLATFGGVVGGLNFLASLTVGGPALINTGTIWTTGAQDYQGAVTLGTNTTLDSHAGGGAITFAKTLDGGFALVSQAGSGLTTFGGAVGAAAKLASLTVAGTSAINGGSVTTTGAQTYQGAATLGAGTVLDSSAGNGAIGFANTLDGGFGFVANAGTGLTTFGGAVGATARLASLTVTGASAINGGSVTTTGAQDYQGAATIGAGTVLDSSAGNGAISFEKTLDGGYALPAKAGSGTTTFGGAVGATAKLAALTVTGASAINGGSIATTGAQDYQGAVSLGAGALLDSSAGNGAITFEKTLDGGSALAANAGTGLTTFTGAVGSTARLASLTVTGTSAINGGSVTTTGLQDYKGAATLGAGTVLDSSAGNGAITFEKTLDGGFALSAAAGTGLTTFGGAVGSAARLASLTVTGALAINGGSVTTTGAQDYKGAVSLGAGTMLDSSAGNGAITFEQALDGGFGLTANAGTGLTTFGGAVGAAAKLASLTVTGASAINGGGVTTIGVQDYQGAATIGAGTTLDSSAGNGAITFEKTLDGGFALTANAGTGLTTFTGAVGSTARLASLAVTGTSAINGGSVTTTGAQDYKGAATIGAATTLDSSAGNGAISFENTLDGGFALATNAGTGATMFGGQVGAAARLASVTIAGPAAINGGGIATSGLQDYKGAVTIGAATTLDSSTGSGAITFEKTLDGGFSLIANAGGAQTTFGGIVGGATKLASLAVTGTSLINTAAISSTGTQTYGGAVTLGTVSQLAGSTVTFASTLDGAFGLTVAGNGVFSGPVGHTTALDSLTVTGTSQIGTSQIGTTKAQAYQGAVTLAVDSTLASADTGVTFGSTLDGAHALTINAIKGTVAFNGTVGATTPLTSLTFTATGATIGQPIVAGTIDIIDSGSTLYLGDLAPYTAAGAKTGTAGTDFILDKTAIGNLQSTGTLTIDASQYGKPGVVTGNFAIAGKVQAFNIYGLGSLFVWGNIVEGGTALTSLQLGGDGTAPADMATQLTMIATTAGGISDAGVAGNAGAAVYAPTAAVSFNAAALAAGQDAGFLGLLGMTPGKTISQPQAQGMINNPGSALYFAAVAGGAPYAAKQLVVANSMSVRFTNFALFQNTGAPGLNSGITLGTISKPATPALTVFGGGTANTDPFAVFGSINGVTGISTALLGGSVISAQNISVPISRINGCVIGSSAGCITPAPLSTTLNAVDPSHVTIFYANTDYVVAFDPLVGTNNESLFNDFGSLGVGDVRDPGPPCRPGDKPCPAPQKGAH